MNRQERRAAEFKAAQRNGHTTARQRLHNDLAHNRIAQALLRARLVDEVRQLRTRAGLQAYIGGDAARVAEDMGRLLYTVAFAAGIHGLGDTPEARILMGTAHALGDVAATPAALESQRAAIISGLAAIERLLPHIHELSLAAGAQHLDQLLTTTHMGTASVEQALRRGEVAAVEMEACEA